MTEKFNDQQRKFTRVKGAYEKREKTVAGYFKAAGLKWDESEIFIRAFKKELQLEIWARKRNEGPYRLIHTYAVCAPSGILGPKRKQGDQQVPEGFYFIDRFNPFSNFHLSLGLNYPNASDRILGNKGNLGGDIFIHGDCVTIGCMPLTDEKIEEVYIMAVETRSCGQEQIPVHVFPCRMGMEALADLKVEYSGRKDLYPFWDNLAEGYRHFESEKSLPAITVDPRGKYIFR